MEKCVYIFLRRCFISAGLGPNRTRSPAPHTWSCVFKKINGCLHIGVDFSSYIPDANRAVREGAYVAKFILQVLSGFLHH